MNHRIPIGPRARRGALTKSLFAGAATLLALAACAAHASAYIVWTDCRSCSAAAIGDANQNGTGVNEHVITSAHTTVPAGLAIAKGHLYWAWESPHYSAAFSPWVQDGVGEANMLLSAPEASHQADFIGDATPPYYPAGIAVAGNYVYVAYGSSGPLWATKLPGPSPWLVTRNGADATGVAAGGGYLYWTDDVTNAIARGKLNGSGGVKEVDESFIKGAHHPYGVTVRGDYVYWANQETGAIGRAKTNGSHVDERFITGAHRPRGVATDNEFLYWTNFGNGTIGRAKLDGKSVTEKLIKGAKGPEWLAVGGLPANASPPKITGTAKQGDKLTEVHGSWLNGTKSYAYRWERCDGGGGRCEELIAADHQSYTLVSADVGHTMRVQEYAQNSYGNSFATSAPSAVVVPPAPVNTALPSIAGTPLQGQTLKSTHGSWSNSPTSFSYQWEDCNTAGTACVPGLAAVSYADTYELGLLDAGSTIRVKVSASNAGGTSAPALSAPTTTVLPLPPANLSAPSIEGDLTQGQTLTEVPASWSNDPASITYKWQSCDPATKECKVVGSEKSYTLTLADVGHTISVAESASNAGGTGGPVSSPTTAEVLPKNGSPTKPVNSLPPVITGEIAVGQTLTASFGAWQGTPPLTYSYQWQLCRFGSCSNVSGATTSTYTVELLPPSDAGEKLRVVVTATNTVGEAAAESIEVGPLPTFAPPPPPPPGGGRPM